MELRTWIIWFEILPNSFKNSEKPFFLAKKINDLESNYEKNKLLKCLIAPVIEKYI